MPETVGEALAINDSSSKLVSDTIYHMYPGE